MPVGHRLEIILLGIQNSSQLFTEINPFATIVDNDIADERIKAGLDKLFDTTEAVRVALYEAALIRYFQPIYNIRLKDSFPSTNLKLLQDCYNKDLRAIIAEINFDGFPYRFYSDKVEVDRYHMAHFDLHSEDNRKSFFSIMNTGK